MEVKNSHCPGRAHRVSPDLGGSGDFLSLWPLLEITKLSGNSGLFKISYDAFTPVKIFTCVNFPSFVLALLSCSTLHEAVCLNRCNRVCFPGVGVPEGYKHPRTTNCSGGYTYPRIYPTVHLSKDICISLVYRG